MKQHRTTIGSLSAITLDASIAIVAPLVYTLDSGNQGIDDDGQLDE